MRLFEVVRDDGDDSVGWGYSYGYYLLDDEGCLWHYSRHSRKAYGQATGRYPRERADLFAVRSYIETGRYPADTFHLMWVKEVEVL